MTERKRIGLREVRALLPGEMVWDTAVTGFAGRRQKGEAVTYLVKYRTTAGRQRWHTIGRHGAPWTPETARAEARPGPAVPDGAGLVGGLSEAEVRAPGAGGHDNSRASP